MPRETDVVHDADLWTSVARLVDRAPRESDLSFHGVELLAAERSRHVERTPSLRAAAARRTAAATSLLAPLVLSRVLAVVESPVVLMKGPEVAARYENPLTRSFRDLDLLVDDAGSVWRALVDSGFEPTGDPALYVGIHHLRPLLAPGLPLVVEIHHQPKWLAGKTPPTRDMLDTAVPSATGVPGLLTLEPARHAVALAVHAWAHVPFGHLGRLIDVAAMAQGLEADALRNTARLWGVGRLWRSTEAVLDSLFRGARRPVSGRIWARHLWDTRERMVIERHLQCWLAPFWAAPPAGATGMTRAWLSEQIAARPEESRLVQARRSAVAISHAFRRVSEHDASMTSRKPW